MASSSVSTPSSSDKHQAQSTFTPTFVRLGRCVWFTLESAHRADPLRAAGLEERLETVGEQLKQVADSGISHVAVGDWSTRRTWSNAQWRAFLITWNKYAEQVFCDGVDNVLQEDEKRLMSSFQNYCILYNNLPNCSDNAPNGLETIHAAEKGVDEVLGIFATRVGDPLEPCSVCGECAVGHKLKRCGRCKLVWYCTKDCQKEDWKLHKRSCVPFLKQNAKQVDQLVRKRYKELRRQGKDTMEAMRIARADYDQDKRDRASGDAGTQVAAMFGLSK